MDPGGIAQTNLQLFRQIQQAGYASADMELVRKAYFLATELFSGLYRGNGKSFVCHAAGTASVAAFMGMRAQALAAGLLHAAYEYGLFPGHSGARMTGANRNVIRRRVGDDVEALVFAYAQLPWSADAIDAMAASGVAEHEAEIVRLRLANELDDLVDLGAAAMPDKFRTARVRAAAAIRLAAHLGEDALADALRQALDENLAAHDFAAAFSGQGSSYREPLPLRAAVRLWLRRRGR